MRARCDCWKAIVEVAHLAERRRLGPRAELLLGQGLVEGTLVAEPVQPDDWLRIAELSGQSRRDPPLAAVDDAEVAQQLLHRARDDRRSASSAGWRP
jgi:hypothetical protein